MSELSKELAVESSSLTSDECSGAATKTILHLPDHFMVSVFRRVSFSHRLRLGEVCKKWNELVHECSLWTVLDLKQLRSSYSYDQLKGFISNYGNAATKELSVLGNYNSYANIDLDWDAHGRLTYLGPEFFVDTLAVRCANLSLIDLECLDLRAVSMQMFTTSFKALKSFSLKLCRISNEFFTDSELSQDNSQAVVVAAEHQSNIALPSIESLYLIRTGLLYRREIEAICVRMPKLTTLVIMQASSTIDDACVEVIASRLDCLEQLDLTNTYLSDHAIYKICESPSLCERLTRLNLSMSSSISNQCLPTIANHLSNLRTLYLTSCFGISNPFLLQNLNQLVYLNINNTSIQNDRIKEFLTLIPKCEVDYGHQKMLTAKKMWTINGSRNSVCSF